MHVAIYNLINGDSLPLDQLMAASALAGLLVVVLYVAAQEFIGGSLTIGAMK